MPSSSRPGPFLPRALAAVTTAALLAAGGVALAAPAAAVGSNPTPVCVAQETLGVCTFTWGSTGAEQVFTVPAGVEDVSITASGAPGGGFFSGGGAGAVSTADAAVTPGQELFVLVGGAGQGGSYQGGGAGGFNGGGSGGAANSTVGGGGGGASDVRTVSSRADQTASLASRLVVGAGGGGAGGCAPGGSAGADGSSNGGCPGGGGGAATPSGGGAGGYSPYGGFGGGGGGAVGAGGGGGLIGGGGGGGGFGGGGGGVNSGGGGGSSLGTVTGFTGSPSVTIAYTTPAASLAFTDPSTATAVSAGSTVSFPVTASNAQGDSWDASSVATLASSDPSDGAQGDAVRFSRVGVRDVTATLGAASTTRAVEVTPGALAALELTPTTSTAVAGTSTTWSASGSDSEGNSLGDVTSGTTFSSSVASDEVQGAVVRATVAGDRVVRASNGAASATATLSVTPAEATSISLDPASPTVTAGVAQPFVVTASDAYGNLADVTAVAELAVPSGSTAVVGGASVTITAAGPDVVTATTPDGLEASASVTVVPAAVATLSAAPSATTVLAGEAVTVTTRGRDAYGNSVGVVTTTLTSSVASDVVDGDTVRFSVAGTRTVTSTRDGVADEVVVTVTPAAAVVLTVVPTASSTRAGRSVDFTVTATDAYGNADDVTAAASLTATEPDEVDGRTVSFTMAGTRTVTASAAGLTATTEVVVTPSAPARIVASVDAGTVVAGSSTTVTAIAEDRYGNPVGDVSDQAAVTSSVSSDVVTARSAAFTQAGTRLLSVVVGAFSDDVVVVVRPAALAEIVVTPGTDRVLASGSTTFVVTGTDGFGNAVAVDPADVVLRTDRETDSVSGTSVTFAAAGMSVVTATVGEVSGAVDVTVVALPVVAGVPVPPAVVQAVAGPVAATTAAAASVAAAGSTVTGAALAWTGSDAAPALGLGLSGVLVGLLLAVGARARARRRG